MGPSHVGSVSPTIAPSHGHSAFGPATGQVTIDPEAGEREDDDTAGDGGQGPP